MVATKLVEALEEAVLSEAGFPDSFEAEEGLPAAYPWEEAAPSPEGDLAIPFLPSLFAEITAKDYPSHEEQLALIYRVREGARAAEVLADHTGTEAKAWRLWARARVLDRPGPPPAPLEGLPGEVRRLRHVVVEGERAYLETVERNLRLVVSVAKRYIAKVPQADMNALVAEGVLGLMRAVDLYDPGLGHRFSTYAFHWIRQAITRHLTRDHLVYLPEEQRRRAAAGEAPPLEEVQVALSLDEPHPETGRPLAEALDSGASPEEEAFKRWRGETLREALRGIGPLHGLVLGLQAGLFGGEPLPLREVAGLVGLTPDKTEKVYEEAKKRLRHLLETRRLEELAVD